MPPRSYDDYEAIPDVDAPRTIEVFEQQDQPQRTGLLDARGRPIYRRRDTVPFGFVGR